MKRLLIEFISELRVKNIPYVILKGIPLDAQLNGNRISRVSHDMDVLINPSHLQRVHNILTQLNYDLKSVITPQQLEEGFVFMLEVGKDLSYQHRRLNICIELHWKTTILSRPGIIGKTQLVSLSEHQSVSVLDSEHNFAYLCLHGAWHNWERLIWLVDLGLMYRKIPLAWQTVITLLKKQNGMRALLETKVLLARQYGIELPYVPYSWSDWLAVTCRLWFTRLLWSMPHTHHHPFTVFFNLFLYKKITDKGRYLLRLFLHRQKSMTQLKDHPTRSKAMLLVMSLFRKKPIKD